MELIFNYHYYTEEKKVKLILNRRRNHERPINNWEDMKAIMRRRFISTHYYRDLFQNLQCLTLRSNRIEEYHMEMEIVMIQANVEKDAKAPWLDFLMV